MTDAPDGRGTIEPTRPVVLLGWAVAGLVLGVAVRPVAERLGSTPPLVTWAQPLGLLLVAAIVGATAWSTWRTLHVRREVLDAHRAVNRLVLARACAIAGAVVGGGYLGYVLAWLGDSSPLADDRVTRSAVAALAGLLTVVASLLLERACRVRSGDGAN